ncbi:unnamed protein product [Coffea canephora]|uniref:Leucine-rich repeat-containing N-terminal plant-type domain-containing protein n=1 Tax=Coffea canephora TaxID=49390 RepID=A0A068VF49_COFCA|nr:unnamed protein product [Coffea canephora]
MNFSGGTIPPQLGNLSFLVSLDISRNNFLIELPHELAHLRRLRYLNLGSIFCFMGSLPPSVCNMSNLETLWLSFNSIDGTIPAEFQSQCSLLQVLSLSMNHLTGIIPKQIGNLMMRGPTI